MIIQARACRVNRARLIVLELFRMNRLLNMEAGGSSHLWAFRLPRTAADPVVRIVRSCLWILCICTVSA